MNLEEFDNELSVVEAGCARCNPGWIPARLARKKILKAFEDQRSMIHQLRIDLVLADSKRDL